MGVHPDHKMKMAVSGAYHVIGRPARRVAPRLAGHSTRWLAKATSTSFLMTQQTVSVQSSKAAGVPFACPAPLPQPFGAAITTGPRLRERIAEGCQPFPLPTLRSSLAIPRRSPPPWSFDSSVPTRRAALRGGATAEQAAEGVFGVDESPGVDVGSAGRSRSHRV